MIGVQRFAHLDGDLAEQAWKIYTEAFNEINYLAAQRHLMTRAEFDDVSSDERIAKYVAVDAGLDGEAVGVAVQTNDLEAWPLISPQYFERRFPAEYAWRSLYYVGYVGGVGRMAPLAFRAMIEAMVEDAGPGSTHIMDFCGYNVMARNMIRAVAQQLTRLNPDVVSEHLDTQTFHAFHFPGGTPDPRAVAR